MCLHGFRWWCLSLKPPHRWDGCWVSFFRTGKGDLASNEVLECIKKHMFFIDRVDKQTPVDVLNVARF